MSKKNRTKFSIIRAAAAMGIALLVAFLLILLSADGANFSEKIAASGKALREMLVSPLFKKNGNFSMKNFSDVLAGMIPIMCSDSGTAFDGSGSFGRRSGSRYRNADSGSVKSKTGGQ